MESRFKGLIGVLLLVALVLRLALVWGGGQFFWPDESRYAAAQDAFLVMADGHPRAGLTSLVAQGDHVGFKLLGLLPATLERLTGVRDPRMAAAFFSLFAWTGLIFLWQWARRTGASLEAQAWTVLLAVTCTSLTFYTRHLFPYDSSLALALAALFVGAKAKASLRRIYAADLCGGCAGRVRGAGLFRLLAAGWSGVGPAMRRAEINLGAAHPARWSRRAGFRERVARDVAARPMG